MSCYEHHLSRGMVVKPTDVQHCFTSRQNQAPSNIPTHSNDHVQHIPVGSVFFQWPICNRDTFNRNDVKKQARMPVSQEGEVDQTMMVRRTAEAKTAPLPPRRHSHAPHCHRYGCYLAATTLAPHSVISHAFIASSDVTRVTLTAALLQQFISS